MRDQPGAGHPPAPGATSVAPARKISVEEIEGGTPLATRRAAALMQAAFLRELGFSKARGTDLLRRHYQSWPL